MHFRSDGVSEFLLHVRDLRGVLSEHKAEDHNITTSSDPLDHEVAYSGFLRPEDMERNAANGEVIKNFKLFSEMTYHALIGKSSDLTYRIETQRELECRIQEDLRTRFGQSSFSISFPSTKASFLTSKKHLVMPSASGTVNERSEMLATNQVQAENRIDGSSLFLTVDLFENSTRLVFPIKLQRVPWVAAAPFFPSVLAATSWPIGLNPMNGSAFLAVRTPIYDEEKGSPRTLKMKNETERQGEKTDSVTPASTFKVGVKDPLAHLLLPTRGAFSSRKPNYSISDQESPSSEIPRNHSPVDRQHLAEALKLIDVLHKENATLKKENAILARLSKEKMKEIREMCKSLEEGAVAIAEVKRLKNKNVQLRMEIEEAKENAMRAFKELEILQRRYSLPFRFPSHPCMADSSGRGTAMSAHSASGRPLHASKQRDRISVGEIERRERRTGESGRSRTERRGEKFDSRRRKESPGSQRRIDPGRRSRLDTPTRPVATENAPRPSEWWPNGPIRSGKSGATYGLEHYQRGRFDTPPIRRRTSDGGNTKERNPHERGRRGGRDALSSLNKDGGRRRIPEGGSSPTVEARKCGTHPPLSKYHCHLSSPGDHRILPSSSGEHSSSRNKELHKEGERQRRANSITSSRCSSRSHERLFQMSTAASRERVQQQREDFRKTTASCQVTHARSRLATR